MRKAPAPKGKLTLSLILLLAALAVAAGGTVAIYTSQVFQRSVVRNRDSEAIRFSSNKLYRVADGTPLQLYYYPMSKYQTTMSFTVCNYDQSKSTVVSEKDIGYSVTFSIPEGTNTFDYTVNGTSSVNGKLTIDSKPLQGAKRSSDSYTIDFGSHAYADTKISVTVTPTDLTLTKNTVLQATLIPIEYATTQGVTVKSEFTDSTRGTPNQFAAYNLSVSISGGKGNVVISWDASQLDIDPFFKTKGTDGTDPNTGYDTLTVSMNAEDETGAYLIQFYNHNSAKPTWKAWDQLPITVELKTSDTETTINTGQS